LIDWDPYQSLTSRKLILANLFHPFLPAKPASFVTASCPELQKLIAGGNRVC
jgi:hypothetical protein